MSGSPTHAEQEVLIINTQGLHMRPVSTFVEIAGKFACQLRVLKNELSVDGKSPMEMMLLEAPKGTKLKLVADGDDAALCLAALVQLINDKFNED